MAGAPIPPWPGEPVTLPAGRLFVRTAPAGPGAQPAVYVHGLGGSSTNWTDLMDELRPLLAGYAPDLPGFGSSPPPAGRDYRVDAHARAVAALIEAIGSPVHLLGNSLGGTVAARLAADRPDLVRTLTLISPALPDLRPRAQPLRMALAGLPLLGDRLIRALLATDVQTRVRGSVEAVYAEPARLHPRRLAEWITETAAYDELAHGPEALRRSLHGIIAEYLRPPGRRALWRQAAGLLMPVLAIYGRHDDLVDVRMAAKAARLIPAARVVTLPDVGHAAQMERPRAVAREIRTALLDRTID